MYSMSIGILGTLYSLNTLCFQKRRTYETISGLFTSRKHVRPYIEQNTCIPNLERVQYMKIKHSPRDCLTYNVEWIRLDAINLTFTPCHYQYV